MTVRTESLWLSLKNTKEKRFKYCTYILCSLSIVLCTVRQTSSALLMRTKSVLSLLSFCSNDMYLYTTVSNAFLKLIKMTPVYYISLFDVFWTVFKNMVGDRKVWDKLDWFKKRTITWNKVNSKILLTSTDTCHWNRCGVFPGIYRRKMPENAGIHRENNPT